MADADPALHAPVTTTVPDALVTAIQSALDRNDTAAALDLLRQALASLSPADPLRAPLEQNRLTVLKLRTSHLLALGRKDDALRHAREALERARPLTGLDPSYLRPRAETLRDLAMELLTAREVDLATHLMRAAIAVYPCPTFQVDLTNMLALTKAPAVLTDFCDTLAPADLGSHLFIACLPKSGSSFLRNALLGLTGYRDTFLFYAGAPNEHDLYLPTLLEFATVNTVTQQHARATEANVHLMQAFGITPVVLVRNIFDALVSLDDFYHSGASFSTFFFPDYIQLTPEQRFDLLIDHVAPWYLQFYASWDRVARENRLRVHWLTYETLIADKPAAVREVLAFLGLAVPDDRLVASLAKTESDKTRNRFNQGVTGRGLRRFSVEQVQKIHRLASYFPLTDFTQIGIRGNSST